MKNRSPLLFALFTALALLPALAGCSKKSDATRSNFEDAMRTYLGKRGDLCLGKSAWPIDVTPHDVEIGTRDALQMPVLERLGLVRSRAATVDVDTYGGVLPVEVKRYELTDVGRRDYLSRETIAKTGANVGAKVTEGDLCVAKLTLDKVVGWELSTDGAGAHQALITYTYDVASEPWTHDPAIRKVLPLVAHVVEGGHAVQLKEVLTLTPAGWVASELLSLEGLDRRDGKGPADPAMPRVAAAP